MRLALVYFFSLCLLLSSLSGIAQEASDLDALLPDMEELYLYLHQHPELSFYETETSAYLAKELRELGFEVTEKVGGNGIIGVMKNGKGPVVMMRADMDALPVTEQTGLEYASKVTTTDEAGKTVGVMHACGHDVHMTVWMGTARYLAENRKLWKGTLIALGQPAEERSGGAKAMLADGLYTKFPVPDYAVALHVSASVEAGKVAYRGGYALANVDMVDIKVKGKGGHGAYPHTTKDPVVLSARIITTLQTIVSREISPLEPAVVTVGSIHGGTKGNVIGNEVNMELTLRSYSDEVRNALIEKIKRICKGEAIAAGLEEELFPEVVVRDEFTPALKNSNKLAEKMGTVFAEALGAENVKVTPPVMGGEDFGRYGRTEEQVPIFMYWLGAVSPEKKAAANRGELSLPSLHSPFFAPDYPLTIKTGIESMRAAVIALMPKK